MIGLLSSCEELAFRQPMPHQVADLKQFPAECVGTFISESDVTDTLIIYPDSVAGDRFMINSDNVIRPFGKYYIVNQRKRDRWTVAAIRPVSRKAFDIYWFNMEGDKNKNAISKITKTAMVQDPETGKDYMLVDPSTREFRRMLKSKAFQRRDRFRRLGS